MDIDIQICKMKDYIDLLYNNGYVVTLYHTLKMAKVLKSTY